MIPMWQVPGHPGVRWCYLRPGDGARKRVTLVLRADGIIAWVLARRSTLDDPAELAGKVELLRSKHARDVANRAKA